MVSLWFGEAFIVGGYSPFINSRMSKDQKKGVRNIKSLARTK
jgi:hypothetical protein